MGEADPQRGIEGAVTFVGVTELHHCVANLRRAQRIDAT